MEVHDIGGTDAQLFIEQLQHRYGQSFSDYGFVPIPFEQIEVILGSGFYSYTITSWQGPSSYGNHDQNGFMVMWYLFLLCLVRDGACLFAYSSMLRGVEYIKTCRYKVNTE